MEINADFIKNMWSSLKKNAKGLYYAVFRRYHRTRMRLSAWMKKKKLILRAKIKEHTPFVKALYEFGKPFVIKQTIYGTMINFTLWAFGVTSFSIPKIFACGIAFYFITEELPLVIQKMHKPAAKRMEREFA